MIFWDMVDLRAFLAYRGAIRLKLRLVADDELVADDAAGRSAHHFLGDIAGSLQLTDDSVSGVAATAEAPHEVLMGDAPIVRLTVEIDKKAECSR